MRIGGQNVLRCFFNSFGSTFYNLLIIMCFPYKLTTYLHVINNCRYLLSFATYKDTHQHAPHPHRQAQTNAHEPTEQTII